MDKQIYSWRTLMHLVRLDENDHIIKQIALLLLSAMNDWPTKEHHDIIKTITQFKDFFAYPFVLERYNLLVPKWTPKTLRDANWYLEAGASLHELITLANSHLNGINFDEIVNMVLNYYQQEFMLTDFIAKLTYTETKNKKTKLLSGAKTYVRFGVSETNTSAMVTFAAKQSINPGDTAEAKFKLSSSRSLKQSLSIGMNFEWLNAGKVIGNGKITELVNSILEL